MDYTERISRLMTDIVARVPALSFIDMRRVLVFARAGRTGADGAFAGYLGVGHDLTELRRRQKL